MSTVADPIITREAIARCDAAEREIVQDLIRTIGLAIDSLNDMERVNLVLDRDLMAKSCAVISAALSAALNRTVATAEAALNLSAAEASSL